MLLQLLDFPNFFFNKVISAPFLEKTEEVELSNSRAFGELRLDDMPSTLGVDFPVLCSPPPKVNLFHVIFNLKEILVATHFDRGGYQKVSFCTIFFKP
jgi:hypothetical protein